MFRMTKNFQCTLFGSNTNNCGLENVTEINVEAVIVMESNTLDDRGFCFDHFDINKACKEYFKSSCENLCADISRDISNLINDYNNKLLLGIRVRIIPVMDNPTAYIEHFALKRANVANTLTTNMVTALLS